MKYQFQCLYCGHTWIKHFFELPDPEELKCPTCKDSRVKKLKLDTQDKFGYNWEKLWKRKKQE